MSKRSSFCKAATFTLGAGSFLSTKKFIAGCMKGSVFQLSKIYFTNTVLGDSLNGWCLLLIKATQGRLQHWISKDARVMRNL